MKKAFYLVAALAAAITITVMAPSCKHELPDPCATNKIEMVIAKTDAAPKKHDGTLTVSATGGKDFEYSLNGGAFQKSGQFTGLDANTAYRVAVRNSWGCSDTTTVDIGAIDLCAGVTIGVTGKVTNALSGKSDGSLTVTATGGTAFTYSIDGSHFQNTGLFQALAPANYTVTVKNENGCVGTAIFSVGMTDPCVGVTVAVTSTQVNPASGQSNGTITASATGGSGFTYSLNGGAYQASGSFSSLAAGSYTITAKNSNGCMGTATVVLGTNNPCAGVTVAVSATKVDPASGQSNGSITASATGGSGFTYSLNGAAYQGTGSFANLAAGSYTITAKNSNGCLGTATVTLAAANPCSGINLVINTATTTAIPCSSPVVNGSITVTASGSSGLTYSVNNGAYQASNVFSNLVTGNYSITVKDANGCSGTASVVVPSTPQGTYFAKVRTLITNRCSGGGCHMNGGSAAGYNFDSDCNIITYWSKINAATVTNKTMPKSPQAAFTTAEMQQITDWVNAGHRYTD